MASSTVAEIVRACIAPVELDAPSLAYLAAAISEEADFLRDAPGCMTHQQLTHLLTETLEDALVTFELAQDEQRAAALCARFVDRMLADNWIQLAPGSPPAEGDATSASTSPPAAAAYTPPLLSAPVRISDIARGDEARTAELEFTMAQIQRAAASSKWSPAEETTLFQSLADTPAEAPAVDDEDEDGGEGGCAMCARVMPLTRHHLIPKMHHKHGIWKNMSREYLENHVLLCCRPCHSALHKMEDERTLATSFHTLELIMADERMQRWTAYISKRRVHTMGQTKGQNKLRNPR